MHLIVVRRRGSERRCLVINREMGLLQCLAARRHEYLASLEPAKYGILKIPDEVWSDFRKSPGMKYNPNVIPGTKVILPVTRLQTREQFQSALVLYLLPRLLIHPELAQITGKMLNRRPSAHSENPSQTTYARASQTSATPAA